MKEKNFGELHVRKWYTQMEETHANETGRLADGEPVHKYLIAAAIQNPHAGRDDQDLTGTIKASVALGKEFGRRIRELAGNRVVSYGKACLVGVNGEYEHGNAFLSSDFANPVREALGGAKAWVPSTGKRGVPGTEIDVPLAHKDALYVRSHYDTISATFGDAPMPDEVLIIFGFSTRGRLHARLGGPKASEIKGEDGLY
ncbi:amino acid synthesis family protein [Pusillimonas sp. TS35]|uniref:amino acid synthesis family protein n=1 Tax=Paracandidimonas lactea TaxID=2895524 RepID=UPI00136E48DF|nr:amino acid synthesis family protein [Paracandidimonas lactea]MYN14426.1 amino acid synthesis family protein [Pusillimonas sp. TS35]